MDLKMEINNNINLKKDADYSASFLCLKIL